MQGSRWVLCACLLQTFVVTGLFAGAGPAQNVKSVKEVTVTLDNARETIGNVFNQIEAKTNFRFIFETKHIDNNLLLNFKQKTASINSILLEISKQSNLKFKQINHTINVSTKEAGERKTPEVIIILQGQTVTGRVTSMEDGEPLPGVNIIERGTTNGTVTDIQGRYSIDVTPGSKLVFSYIGFVTEEVEVNGQSVIDVVMVADIKSLEEIVVIGYGTMQKKDLTGSIIQVLPDAIENENPRTVQDILRGTPGLNVGFDASAKGGGSMQIRGQRSVYTGGGHNDPLIVLDGMIFYGELSEINPDDIAQIDVLKDASAAAVYGARAANGVIIISTKKGEIGKPTVKFTSNVGFTTMGANRNVFSPEGYLKYREDWYTTPTYGINDQTGKYEEYVASLSDKPGYYAKPTPENLAKYGITLEEWRSYTNNGDISDDEIWAERILLQGNPKANYLLGKTFDWYDQSFRTGFNQDYNISVSGANDRMNYYMSMGYLSNEGVAVGNEYRSIRSNLKVGGKVNNWLELGANVNFQDRSDGDLAVDWGTQIMNSPYATYADENGKPVVDPMGWETAFIGYNYDFERQFRELEKGFTVLNSILTAKVKLPFNIVYTFNASPRYQFFYDRYFESSAHPNWSPTNRGANREQAKRFDWSLNNTIHWNHTFADKHRVDLTLVQEAEERQYWMDRIEARNILPTDALGFHETKTGDKERSSFDTHDSRETADAMLARLFYSYDDRYMFTGSVRRDGYSAFGTANPRATFYSMAFAWTFTNESFFNWDPLSMGKLRLSWGQNGNRGLENPYLALADLGAGTGATQGYLTNTGDYVQYRYMSMGRMANPHLQWEKTTAWNIGLDYGFLNNRIRGTVDYYIMPTTDMVMNQTLPGFSGFGSITCNLGEVENRGIEISLNSQNISNNVLEWSASLGFFKYKNTIKHLYYEYEDVLDENGNVIGTKEKDDVGNRWFIGQPISAIWDYRVTGIWQADEAEEAAKYGQRPGDPKVANNYTADDKDNGDGTFTPVYNDKDKEFLGQTAPPIHWSLRNDFTFFKNLNLSFNIYSYWGHKSTSANYLNQDNSTSSITNGFNVYAKEYWTLNNPTNDYARLDAKGPAGITSPAKLYDRSFIRFENLSLGYTFPKRMISRLDVQQLKVYGSIRNVAVWAKDWEYWDPETGSIAPRIFTLGLSVTL